MTIRNFFVTLGGVLAMTSCSSVEVHSLHTHARPLQAPSRIMVERFSAPLSRFHLGPRSAADKRVLRDQIVEGLASRTAGQIRIYAADARVAAPDQKLLPGQWLVRGEILEVDQGSRALRSVIGFGSGRTVMRTRVTVSRVTKSGLLPLIRFNTVGSSGMEPGVALGVATGGVGSAMAIASTSGSLLMNSLPGVSTDIDRTSYEIAAVLSAFLDRHGLLSASRQAISPNMQGELISPVNLNRAIPEPLRPKK